MSGDEPSWWCVAGVPTGIDNDPTNALPWWQRMRARLRRWLSGGGGKGQG